MCEWLSCHEWFDVQLLCGGHTFNAHRAVLASVSTFLRKILLSCSTEDAPVFIVLPEFDTEAMSSVLYYIYNGEVIIKKKKYTMFLDIIKAMQIFIDTKYLMGSEIDRFEYPNVKSTAQLEEVFRQYHSISNSSSNIINLRKDHRSKDTILLQNYSVSETNLYKNHVLCQDLSKQQRSCLENLQLPFMDRQRNSFLRDLFIETHPGNGYVNGVAEGVLAISSECYREPRSVLLTNANGHLQAGALLSTTTTQHSSHVFSNNNPQLKSDRSHGLDQSHKSDYNFSHMFLPGANFKLTHVDYSTSSETFKKPFCHATNLASTDVRQTFTSFKTENHRIRTRYTILNQVLENPWCARQPTNYKPLCKYKHGKKSMLLNINGEKETETPVNHDGNNNVHQESPNISSPPILNHVPLSLTSSENENNYKCNMCEQVLSSPETLAAHMKRHNSGIRYTCNECSKSFSQLRNFKYHMSVHRGTREYAATCPICGKYFNDRGYLSSHMKIHRNRKEYKCSMCPKSFNQRVAYNMHVRIHTGVKPHVCEECGKAFSRKMLLKQHQRTHSGERPYACLHCDKRFADRSNMTLHLRLHSGIKPFSCTLCPKSFTKKHHLKSHLNFHTGIKPYSCPRCKLAFTQSSNMRTHLKKCSGPKPPNTNR